MSEVKFTVEKREGRSWGLIVEPPTEEAIQDTIDVSIGLVGDEAWPLVVLENLVKYTPWLTEEDINTIPIVMRTVSQGSINSWHEAGMFVADDDCPDMYRTGKRWLDSLRVPKSDATFIDGDGFGQYYRYAEEGMKDMGRTFDEKYLYKMKRPQTILSGRFGAWVLRLFNYFCPPHPEDPTGHGFKGGLALKRLRVEYALSDYQDSTLKVFFAVLSHGRSYGPVHWLSSNLKSWALLEIEGCEGYLKDGVLVPPTLS